MASPASYFTAGQYGNAALPYLGFGATSAGVATGFLLGLIGVPPTGNAPSAPIRLYGAFRPGIVRASTLLSAFPVRQGPHPRLAALADVVSDPRDPNPTKPLTVPPYGNTMVFT